MNAQQSQIEEQAVSWLIRLDSDEVSAADKSQFNSWLDAHPRHRVAFLRQQVAWKKVDKLRSLASVADLWGEDDVDRRWYAKRPWIAVAATVALAALALAAWNAVEPFGWKTYVTQIGNSERIALQDGSIMILNTNSQARVRLTSKRRSIELLRGEGLFEVAPDPQRPFDVRANDTTVRAIGTSFSVRLHDKEEVEVVVTEGRVALSSVTSPAAGGPALSAGDSILVRPEGLQLKKLGPEDIPRKLAWQNGLLRFNGETLVEAVAEFNRYNRAQLTIVDPALADLRVGGGFQTTDIDSFLAALEGSFGVRAVRTAAKDADAQIIRLTGAHRPN
jgi:transmembrane sensor